MKNLKASFVISAYNEQDVLEKFYSEITKELSSQDFDYELIFINDGSVDATLTILENIFKKDKSVVVINFSRNFGHEAAMMAGIEHSDGNIIICMDADLQHPPSIIKYIIEKYLEGFDIVNMVRRSRADASIINQFTSKYFYKILNSISSFKIEPNASDFFMISKKVALVLMTHFKDNNRFVRGFIQQIGFNRTTITFDAPERAGGQSKYSFLKLLVFSISIIVANSRAPLRISIFISFLFAFFSFGLGTYSLIMKILGSPFSGYTTIIVFLSLAFSLLFLVLGVMGEYIGNIYHEIKNRPNYIIEKILKH